MRRFLKLYEDTKPSVRNEQILQLCMLSPETVSVPEVIAQYKSDGVTANEKLMLRKLLINITSEDVMESLEV